MKMIKIELKKAFTGNRFWLAFGIGQFLGISSILTVYRSWLSQRDYIQYWENRFPVRQAYTLYNVWMLNEQMSIGRVLFFFWLPFLAAFPFAALESLLCNNQTTAEYGPVPPENRCGKCM